MKAPNCNTGKVKGRASKGTRRARNTTSGHVAEERQGELLTERRTEGEAQASSPLSGVVGITSQGWEQLQRVQVLLKGVKGEEEGLISAQAVRKVEEAQQLLEQIFSGQVAGRLHESTLQARAVCERVFWWLVMGDEGPEAELPCPDEVASHKEVAKLAEEARVAARGLGGLRDELEEESAAEDSVSPAKPTSRKEATGAKALKKLAAQLKNLLLQAGFQACFGEPPAYEKGKERVVLFESHVGWRNTLFASAESDAARLTYEEALARATEVKRRGEEMAEDSKEELRCAPLESLLAQLGFMRKVSGSEDRLWVEGEGRQSVAIGKVHVHWAHEGRTVPLSFGDAVARAQHELKQLQEAEAKQRAEEHAAAAEVGASRKKRSRKAVSAHESLARLASITELLKGMGGNFRYSEEGNFLEDSQGHEVDLSSPQVLRLLAGAPTMAVLLERCEVVLQAVAREVPSLGVEGLAEDIANLFTQVGVRHG